LYQQGKLSCFRLVLPLVQGKIGLEIGGPSAVFQSSCSREYGWSSPLPLYEQVGSLDNCNFSRHTLWSTHDDIYRFSRRRTPGKLIIADGSALTILSDHTYDFVLSSHNLEHFANPVKALLEWKRITRPGGALVLVLPDYRRTFDHRRMPTPVEHMLDDYQLNMSEDDVTHVDEVLKSHDLAMDGNLKTGGWDELALRSRSNVSNRALHHHVFDEHNSTELMLHVGLDILAFELAKPHHIVIVGRWESVSSGIAHRCSSSVSAQPCSVGLSTVHTTRSRRLSSYRHSYVNCPSLCPYFNVAH
jgi:SAM-dependent methyltransferase